MFFGDHHILGQVIEAVNVPQNIDSYQCKGNKIKMYRLKYEVSAGQSLGLYETVGLIVVIGDGDEVLFNYGHDKVNSKLLYSYQKRKTPNSFSGTLFNRDKDMTVSGELSFEYSDLFFFLPSITERSDKVNEYLNNINITLLDSTQNNFKQWLAPGQKLEPQHLELFGEKKKVMRHCVVAALKQMLQYLILT